MLRERILLYHKVLHGNRSEYFLQWFTFLLSPAKFKKTSQKRQAAISKCFLLGFGEIVSFHKHHQYRNLGTNTTASRINSMVVLRNSRAWRPRKRYVTALGCTSAQQRKYHATTNLRPSLWSNAELWHSMLKSEGCKWKIKIRKWVYPFAALAGGSQTSEARWELFCFRLEVLVHRCVLVPPH